MRVFLADDEDLELFGIEKMLSDMPLELENMRDGAKWRGGFLELCPDVVISDVKMPKLDGVAMTRRLREQGFPERSFLFRDIRIFPVRGGGKPGARSICSPVNRMELERLLSLLAGEALPEVPG